MDSYRIMLVGHVLAALVGLGVTFAYPFMLAVAERNGTGATRLALQTMERIERFLVFPGALLLLVFGAGLIFSDVTGYSDDFPVWLMIAIAWYVVAFAVAVGVQNPTASRALATLEGVPDTSPLPEAYAPLGKRMQMVGGLLGVSVIGIAFLMVWGGEGGF